MKYPRGNKTPRDLIVNEHLGTSSIEHFGKKIELLGIEWRRHIRLQFQSHQYL